ncbi:MAG: transposase [Firmicutes bacterium]|nr:transposase [Bacillota bacterium]
MEKALKSSRDGRRNKKKTLRQAIRRIYIEYFGIYGSRKIQHELKRSYGIEVNHKVVENVMKEPGVISKFTTFGCAKSQLLCNCPHLSLRLNVCEMGGENVIFHIRISQNKNIVFAEHFNAHFQNGWNRENISPKNSLPQK